MSSFNDTHESKKRRKNDIESSFDVKKNKVNDLNVENTNDVKEEQEADDKGEVYTLFCKDVDDQYTYNNKLSNGKLVDVEYIMYWHYANFEITLNAKEKKELLRKQENGEKISWDEYHMIATEQESGYDGSIKIINKESYTKEELKEIHRLMYFTSDEYSDENPYESEDEFEEDHKEFRSDIMDANGWNYTSELGTPSENFDLELAS
jgi:hypothetical protein